MYAVMVWIEVLPSPARFEVSPPDGVAIWEGWRMSVRLMEEGTSSRLFKVVSGSWF